MFYRALRNHVTGLIGSAAGIILSAFFFFAVGGSRLFEMILLQPDWGETSGRIGSPVRAGRATLYEFSFRVDGRTYQGTCGTLRSFTTGQNVRVLYDRNYPARAVVIGGFRPGARWSFIGLLFLLILVMSALLATCCVGHIFACLINPTKADESTPRRAPEPVTGDLDRPEVAVLQDEAEAGLPEELLALQDEAEASLAEMEASPVASEATVADMKRRLDAHRASLAQTDFTLNNFDEWRTGQMCRWRREVLSAGNMAQTVLVSSLGWGIIGLFFAPVVVVMLALVAVTILRLFPGDIRVIHLVITDLFGFQTGNMLTEIAFMFLVIFAWNWLCFDCAFSPREVVLDWKANQLRIRSRRGLETARLSGIKALLTRHVVTTASKSKKETASSPGPASDDSQAEARLEAQLPQGDVVLLETDPSEVSTKRPFERLLPLAEPLARALRVGVRHEAAVYDNFDVVGFPRKARLRNARAIWRNSGRGPKLGVLVLLAALATLYGWRAYASFQENTRWLEERDAREVSAVETIPKGVR
uniref:DUF3592 domain-containing protein n=1 Tax=uncultured bacterium FLS18 TaxID=654935 RepID=C6G405_9BACT|nr:hypothetical protein [uncultured bacterium FLS18]